MAVLAEPSLNAAFWLLTCVFAIERMVHYRDRRRGAWLFALIFSIPAVTGAVTLVAGDGSRWLRNATAAAVLFSAFAAGLYAADLLDRSPPVAARGPAAQAHDDPSSGTRRQD
jgi:hypothetical protein